MIMLDEKLFMAKPVKGSKVHLCREINGILKYICSWYQLDKSAEIRQSVAEKELCPLCMHAAIQMGWAIFNHDIWKEKHTECMVAFKRRRGWRGNGY